MCNATTVNEKTRAQELISETKENLKKTVVLLAEAIDKAHELDSLEDLKMFYLTSQELVNIALEIQRGFALAKGLQSAVTATEEVTQPYNSAFTDV